MKNETKVDNAVNDKVNMGVRILETQEIERKRIAMDLHDSTIQNMTSVIHRIELCSKLIDINKERTKSELENVTTLVREIINEMRDIVYNLQPTSLIDIGLSAAINRLVEKNNLKSDIITVFKESEIRYKLSSIKEITIYRVIQEAVNNALNYSDAKVISIEIIYNDNNIALSISDDGIGFEISGDIENSKAILKARNEGHGYGIAIMRERIYLLKGEFRIKSGSAKGTRIEINIPRYDEK